MRAGEQRQRGGCSVTSELCTSSHGPGIQIFCQRVQENQIEMAPALLSCGVFSRETFQAGSMPCVVQASRPSASEFKQIGMPPSRFWCRILLGETQGRLDASSCSQLNQPKRKVGKGSSTGSRHIV
mmetsp:Transcript_58808/g.80800  ORF Transcript_58808/g.80800 Transcript_58808/m.80800 type:complete len:126 (-) Transcript_58808:52-429(-)